MQVGMACLSFRETAEEENGVVDIFRIDIDIREPTPAAAGHI